MNLKEILCENTPPNTLFDIWGDIFVVPGSWDAIKKHLDTQGIRWIRRQINNEDMTISPTDDQPTHTVEDFVHHIDVAVTSSQMDG